jgi:hypothetical protein
MFTPSSRYATVATITVRLPDGREVSAVKLRGLPATNGAPYTLQLTDRLDVLARRRYEDSTCYWHVADTNTELEAADFAVSGRVIQVPET